ncbi:MAG: hypothetical protein MMC33_001294 [Icmadophila ericetorum]|nr:hypothetical protein [Icmadophila ericetorum]
MATDWSLDYCFTCERQTAGEPYCSQACRLADLETSTCGSEPVSPTNEKVPSSWLSTSSHTNSGFQLAPAFDFSAYRTGPSSSIIFRAPTHHSSSASKYSTYQTESNSSSSIRALTPSSSRSSLASMQSMPAQGENISSQARNELRDYTNSFDQVRDWRRRVTAT